MVVSWVELLQPGSENAFGGKTFSLMIKKKQTLTSGGERLEEHTKTQIMNKLLNSPGQGTHMSWKKQTGKESLLCQAF